MIKAPRGAGEEAMAELASAIGTPGARALARHFGGTTVHIPKTIGDSHPLRVIGDEAAIQLSVWAGGSRINVPKQPERRARVRDLHRAGTLTRAQIARETGYSERHVYRLLSKDDDRQLDLFDEQSRTP